MSKNYFMTITGLSNYYGFKPYKIGQLVKIEKEPDNNYDGEAIRVVLPHIDTIGYVANSVKTVYQGTMSAGRLYDKFDDYAYAEVLFITHSSVIAILVPTEYIEQPADDLNNPLGFHEAQEEYDDEDDNQNFTNYQH